MATILSTVPNQQMTAFRRPNPLLVVTTWELRRLRASRATWVMLPLAFGYFLFGIWNMKTANSVGFDDNASFNISATSAEGLIDSLVTLSLTLALILPFVNADGTSRDLKLHTDELLMSTPLPGWAYIWGRYLACLFMSLILTVLLLAALLLMGPILHYLQADYPPPQPAAILSIWAVALLPLAIFMSSVCFTLGTLLQRDSNLVKIGMIFGWFAVALLLPVIPSVASGGEPSWYSLWEPTNTGMVALFQAQYTQGIQAIFEPARGPLSDRAILSALTNLEQQMPNLGPYILPRLIWVGLALALVGVLARSFKRFSNAKN